MWGVFLRRRKGEKRGFERRVRGGKETSIIPRAAKSRSSKKMGIRAQAKKKQKKNIEQWLRKRMWGKGRAGLGTPKSFSPHKETIMNERVA